jgi:VCBS repeat-containing protein
MANDLGGNAKTLYSVDDGNNYLTDLLTADALINGFSVWEATGGGDTVRIDNGNVDLDLTHSISALTGGSTNINGLAAGDYIIDTFKYTIQLGNGALSWGTATVNIQGSNDPASISGDHTGTLSEDDTNPVTGKLTVVDPDHGQSHTQAVTDGATANGLGAYSVDADGNWSYTVNNALVQYLNDNQSTTDSFIVTSLDGTAQQTVTITITGSNDAPSPITYNINLVNGTTSVIGTVTTDGATGVLSRSDILDWDLFLAAGGYTRIELAGPQSGNNSYFNVDGTDLTATTTGLFFNFQDTNWTDIYLATYLNSAAVGFESAGNFGLPYLGAINVDAVTPSWYQIPAPANDQIGSTSITYNIDLVNGTTSVIGTVTTDGSTGVLSASDILDWHLSLTAGGNTVGLVGPGSHGDSYFVIQGNDFTATTTGLFFNFQDQSANFAGFTAPSSATVGFNAAFSNPNPAANGISSGINVDALTPLWYPILPPANNQIGVAS